jgi:hypothetical protein
VTTPLQSDEQKEGSRSSINTILLSSVVIPAALALAGGLLVYFISQALTYDRDHRDLIREVRTRTFGNRWISAYELSKYLLNNRIPAKERPWVRENLIEMYTQAQNKGDDLRLQRFSLAALGTMGAFGAKNGDAIISIVENAVFSKHPELIFQGLYILGNIDQGVPFPWQKFLKAMERLNDYGHLQMAIFTLVKHQVPGRRTLFLKFLNHPNETVTYAAAVGLIEFQDTKAMPLLWEIINWRISKTDLSSNEEKSRESWQLNLLRAFERFPWPLFRNSVSELSKQKENQMVAIKAKTLLLQH